MHQNRILLAVLVLLSAYGTLVAQEKTISGTVKDSNSEPIPGINVVVKGTALGTVTDALGRYSISIPDGFHTLVFCCISATTKEIEFRNQTVIDVIMETNPPEKSLVLALNIPKNVNAISAAVGQISGHEITEAREVSFVSQLEGRVAGVNMSKLVSGPAGSARVVIRGAKSLGNPNQPLYVIDGIPIDNHSFSQAGVWGGVDQGDGLNSISPDDIESITVLKGTSASALYGSRGLNGVIVISTRKSKATNKIGIEFNSNLVTEKVINYTDFQKDYGAGGWIGANGVLTGPTKATAVSSATEYDLNDAFQYGWNEIAWGPRFDNSNIVQPDGVVRKYNYAGDNWKRFYKDGLMSTNSIAISGGKEIFNARLSYASLNNRTPLPNTGFKRDNVMFSFNSKLNDRLTVLGKVMYSKENTNNRPMIADSPGNAVEALYYIPGDQNVELYKGDPAKLGAIPVGMPTPDGKYVGQELQASNNLWGQNPYWAAYQYVNSDERERTIASANARYKFSDFVYMTGTAGVDKYTKDATNIVPAGTGYLIAGSHSETKIKVQEVNMQWVLGHDKTYGHTRVNAFIGANKMDTKFETTGKSYTRYAINSLFGSVELSFSNLLFITATSREDWFSGMPSGKNATFNPSLGSSFIFTDLMESRPAFLTSGKVTASYGRLANLADVNNVVPGTILNPDLKPVKQSEIELGTELRFLNGRLGLDMAYYSQKTADGLFFLNQGTVLTNNGTITNQGLEVTVTGTPSVRIITWDVSLNFAYNKNKVVSLGEANIFVDEQPRTKTVWIEHIVGKPFGMIGGLVQSKTDGKLIYDSQGLPVNDGMYHVLGNGVHKFTGGLNNSLQFKSFNLSFLVDFKFGAQIYSGTNVRMTQGGFTRETLQGREGGAPLTITGATQTGTDGLGNPAYSTFTKTYTPVEAQQYWGDLGERSEDRFVYDASFVKLRQLTLGYTLSKSIVEKAHLRSITLSLVGRNLLDLYKKTPNIDPESNYSSRNAQGLDYFGMLPTRTYGFNLRVVY